MKNMNHILTVLALMLCVSTTASAQDELPTSPALERAIVIEEIEHDPRQALTLYTELAANSDLPDEVRRYAALRLGRVQAKLGDKVAARAAFEQAAKGEDSVARLARADLTDPGQDEERARLLREEARRWIAQFPTKGPEDGEPLSAYLKRFKVFRSMLWIGPGAAPELIRAIEEHRPEANLRGNFHVTNLAYVLWHIGGPEAAAYLDSIRSDENLGMRRAIALGMTGEENARDQFVADNLVTVAEAYLSDSDPQVQVTALGNNRPYAWHRNWEKYETSTVIGLIEGTNVTIQIATLVLLAQQWEHIAGDRGETDSLQQLVPLLARALDDVNPDVVQPAYQLLGRVGMRSQASRLLLVQRLPSLRSDFELRGSSNFGLLDSSDLDITSEEPSIALLLPALRALGPSTSSTQRSRSVDTLMRSYLSHLHRDSLDLVLEYFQLGYDRNNSTPGWILTNCVNEDAEHVLAAMLEEPALESLLGWISTIELAPACWPYLLQLEQRQVQPATGYSDGQKLIWKAMGRTATPAAIAHLVEGLEKDPTPERYSYAVWTLIVASGVRQDADVKDALCRALIVKTTSVPGNWGTPKSRELLVARLIQLGDPRVFNLLPQAEELGLETVALGHIGTLFPCEPAFLGQRAHSAGWLVLEGEVQGKLTPFHGYDDTTLASIWNTLLTRVANDPEAQEWSSLSWALTAQKQNDLPNGFPIPAQPDSTNLELLQVAAQHWISRVSRGIEFNRNWGYALGLAALLDIRRSGEITAPNVTAALNRLHEICLASDDWEVRMYALYLLPSKQNEEGQQALLNALTDSRSEVSRYAMDHIFKQRQPVPRERFELVLSNPNSDIRARAIESLSPFVTGGAADIVKARLKDTSAQVRIEACVFLATQVAANPVPELLVALSDVDANVRSAAADALRAIRFYHDEKAHWDRVFAGTELSSNGAAEALLKQASGSNSNEVRLLAIRSLGVLGAAETLPFLIEWTMDSNAELSAAARAAIARIHASGD